jgi:hypothetical protein
LPAFRTYGIKHILTLRREEEIVEAWDKESSSILETDPTITRKWLDVADSIYESLLNTRMIPRVVRDIRRSLLAHESVFVHWFDPSQTRTEVLIVKWDVVGPLRWSWRI